MALADEAEAATQAGQAVELGQRARDDEVGILVHQRSDVVHVSGDEAGVSLVDEHHRVRRNVLHDTANLLGGEAVARGVVGRCQEQHAGVDAVGVFNHLVHIVGEGVFLLIEGIHLEGAAALGGHAVVVPPGELGDEYLLVVSLHEEVVDGVLQNLLAAVGQQHLLLGHAVDFTDAHADDALLALIVDAGVEAKVFRVEVFHCVQYFLTGLKVELVSVKIVHSVVIL